MPTDNFTITLNRLPDGTIVVAASGLCRLLRLTVEEEEEGLLLGRAIAELARDLGELPGIEPERSPGDPS